MEKIREYLSDLININTTRDTGNISEMTAYLAGVFNKEKISCTIYKDDENVYGISAVIPGKTEEKIVLYSHMDTAPFGNLSKWHFPADKAVYKNHCMCGRGALDGKSAIAVWLRILNEAAKQDDLEKTLVFIADGNVDINTDIIKEGRGLEWIAANTDILNNTALAIAEGGGIPFPYNNKMYFTLQTGEREKYNYSCGIHETEKNAEEILKSGCEKGYYNKSTLEYCKSQQGMLVRRLETEPLYCGMKDYFEESERTDTIEKFGKVFHEAIIKYVPSGDIMPVITEGQTGNSVLRKLGIRTAGFFPFDIQNSLSGLNDANEYITDKSLELAYNVMKEVVSNLINE